MHHFSKTSNTLPGPDLSNDPCTLCGSRGTALYSGLRDVLFNAPGVWSLVRCSRCGLIWLNPKPAIEEIGGFYENYQTHEEYNDSSWLMRLFNRGIPAVILGYRDAVRSKNERFWGRCFSLIGHLREVGTGTVLFLHAKDRGKLLDIGCGSGIFMRRLNNLGWDTWGVEFDTKAAEIASRIAGKDRVYVGNIEDCLFQDGFFDVITLVHVIEHLSDPFSVLKKCMDLLRPGGKIIISTPNAASWGARFFKRCWRGWEPPRHLYIYNPQTLSQLVARAGFMIVQSKTVNNATLIIWHMSFIVKYLNKGMTKLGFMQKVLKFILSTSAWFLEYFFIKTGNDCGETIHCVAQKIHDQR